MLMNLQDFDALYPSSAFIQLRFGIYDLDAAGSACNEPVVAVRVVVLESCLGMNKLS